MSDETCTFSYVALQDSMPRTTTGVERTWLDLKIEFSRQGEGLPGARYFKKISEQGPQLFAVKPDKTVWYHDENSWRQYKTAKDVKYDSKPVEDDSEPGFGEQDGAES